MDQILEIFHLEHYYYLLGFYIQILQDLLVFSPYFFSTMLFHKDGGSKVSVTNCMSPHISMFVPIKSTRNLANVNMGHAQVIGVILCNLLNFQLYIRWYQFIIFQVTLTTLWHWVYSNFMLVFKMLHLNLLNIVIFSSGLFLQITLIYSKQFRLSSNINFQIQNTKKQ